MSKSFQVSEVVGMLEVFDVNMSGKVPVLEMIPVSGCSWYRRCSGLSKRFT
jgi:hypothetical protein